MVAFHNLAVSAGDELAISFVRTPGFAPGTMAAFDVTVQTSPVSEPQS